MGEPSIYDYIVSLFDRDTRVEIPEHAAGRSSEKKDFSKEAHSALSERKKSVRFIIGSALAIIGQYFLEPSVRMFVPATALYLISLILIWPSFPRITLNKRGDQKDRWSINVRWPFIYFSLVSLLIAFILFQSHTFTLINLVFWLAGVITMVLGFRNPSTSLEKKSSSASKRDMVFTLLLVFAAAIAGFVRIYQIEGVPAEMYSDHAEKLLDVMDIIEGQFPIYFVRNTGREPLQFYITALIIQLFNTGFGFLSLKLGTVAFGLLTLPFIYLIGKEIGNRWVGLAALFLAGIAYWPNVISRVGLRYSLYPLFAAPAMFYHLRAMRRRSQNDLVLSGLCIGLGLHGYSSFRIFPLYVIFVIILFSTQKNKKIDLGDAFAILLIIGLVAFSVFLPLFRFWFDNPGMFSYRMMSRLTPIENAFEQPAMLIFLKNTVESLFMPFVNNGRIWVHSVTNRPALGFVSAGLYFVGMMSAIKEALRKKSYPMIALLIAVPVLMLPSILSLAYPGENPSLNRSAGAYIPIFVLAGYGLVQIGTAISHIFLKKAGKLAILISIAALSGLALHNNFQIVFETYNAQFREGAWNTSEIGAVISEFLEEESSPEREAYVIPYPHWVDTRLVGFTAGYPGKDFALWREDIPLVEKSQGDKMFIFKPEDAETSEKLSEIFPNGESSRYYSTTTGKDFIIYTVLSE